MPNTTKAVVKVIVYRRPTPIRKRERWGIILQAGNGKTLMSSEKYANHVDALSTANLIAKGQLQVVDEMA